MTMSSIKDKKLLLLGILAEHSMHGYQLNELLKSPGTAIQIGKANAYQLLNKFEEEGWVTGTEERVEPYPPRLVYAISEAGKEEFSRLLQERLAEHIPGEFFDLVSLNFIDILESDLAVTLLEQRAVRLADRCDSLSTISDDIRASHPGLDLLIQHLELERSFLNELIEKKRSQDVTS